MREDCEAEAEAESGRAEQASGAGGGEAARVGGATEINDHKAGEEMICVEYK